MKKIILNQIQTPDGTILTSHDIHDYKRYKDKNGEVYMVDGGTEYLRRHTNKEPYKELSIYSDSPFEVIRENYYRGTFNEEGNRTWISISKMTIDHLRNCITYNEKKGLGNGYANKMYRKELNYRGIN